jgi:hypothetical protein
MTWRCYPRINKIAIFGVTPWRVPHEKPRFESPLLMVGEILMSDGASTIGISFSERKPMDFHIYCIWLNYVKL